MIKLQPCVWKKKSAIRRCFEFPNVPKGTAYAVYSMGAIVLYVTIFLAIFRLGKIDLRSNPSGQAKFLALRDDNPLSEPNWLSVATKWLVS